MLNASVGVQRVIGRLRRPQGLRADQATELHARSLAAARRVRGGWDALGTVRGMVPTARGRSLKYAARRDAASAFVTIGHDRILAIAVAAILLVASLISVSVGGGHAKGPTGGTNGNGNPARLAVGGTAGLDRDDSLDGQSADLVSSDGVDTGPTGQFAGGVLLSPDDQATVGDQSGTIEDTVAGPYLEDGTLLKPVFVDTSIQDGSDLLRTYKVKSGDTLTGIARKFHISMMTLWWANKLDSKDKLHQGQVLTIPPVSGLVVTVTSSDTLDSLASKHKVDKQDILDANGLDDPNLVVGQVLVIPGAKGKPIPTPKPTKRPIVTRPRGGGGGGGGAGGETHYTGGSLLWPVVGGGNYISQYFHYGHWAIDIAADYGSRVRAAAGGRVVFAGWKSNGGGYQVWISHGGGMYTTYNHMSAITVGNGESVGRGDQVGRVGQSGNATGPHLHFEVWRGGEPWNGGTRVNPLAYF